MQAAAHLRVVKDVEPEAGALDASPAPRAPDGGELALVTTLLVLNLVPVAGELAGIGRWSPDVVGFAAGALLLTGRELWSQLRARAGRKGGREEGSP